MSASDISRVINVAKVIALLCKKHKISIHTINQLTNLESHFNVYEMMMREQISQQLNDQELMLDRYDTLDIDRSDDFDEDLKPPSDKSDDSNEDYVSELLENKPRQSTASITRKQFLKTYKYWMYQDKVSDEPIVIDNNKFPEKRKLELISRKYKYIDKQCYNLCRWAQQIKEGKEWTIREINKVVYAKFLKKRDHHQIVTDRYLR